ncbi:MAG TPA: acetate/propionate family kinase [Candidatus Angelobacter sp.]|jgi:acetate kinase|nr:acetate/propionate family kinase [Candidatus Angelobacter sp.]
MENIILCVNAGSSSLKFALYAISGSDEKKIAEGAIEGIGQPSARLWIRNSQKQILEDRQAKFADAHETIAALFTIVERPDLPRPAAVGHRIVHGGMSYTEPQKITAQMQDDLQRLIPLAPLHLPSQIELIKAIQKWRPALPQIACFDTAFHCRMPELARRFPLPRDLWDKGVRRYGFHGLSYEYVLSALGNQAQEPVLEVSARAEGRAIIAHLGNGASMAAVRDGIPVDTSMGLTPTGGFMMGTRSGDLDPGLVLYLLRSGYDAQSLGDLLDHNSGLLGVSGLSGDMKTLLEKRSSDPHADQAVAMFCYGVRKFLGAFAAVLGGLDTLVFTGGIGERAAPVRQEICRNLQFLGISLDENQNEKHAAIISTPKSRCIVRVVPTDEDLMIARHTSRMLD